MSGDTPTPNDAAVEAAVLSAMLLDRAAAEKAAASATADLFHVVSNRVIFGAMCRLLRRGAPLDPICIRDEFNGAGDLDRAGGLEYLATLIDAVPTGANVEHHIRILSEQASRRQLAGYAQQLPARRAPLAGGMTDLTAIVCEQERPVSRAALDTLRRVEQILGSVTVTPPVLLAIVRELRGTDPLTVEVGRAGTVERLRALGVADAEQQVDALLHRYGLVTPDDRTLPRQWWDR